ncbi:MAG: hypothetical protein WCK98_04490 [bacterium]
MPLAKTFVYAELTQESKHKLEAAIPYKFAEHFGTHITIDWDVDFDLYKDIIGKKFKLKVGTLAGDNKIEAIRVDLIGTGLRSVNKNPHITWSADTGVNPYYSNFMLYVAEFDQDKKFTPIEIEVEVLAG